MAQRVDITFGTEHHIITGDNLRMESIPPTVTAALGEVNENIPVFDEYTNCQAMQDDCWCSSKASTLLVNEEIGAIYFCESHYRRELANPATN